MLACEQELLQYKRHLDCPFESQRAGEGQLNSGMQSMEEDGCGCNQEAAVPYRASKSGINVRDPISGPKCPDNIFGEKKTN